MESLKNLPLAFLIRHGLTGFVGILLFAIYPIAVFDYDLFTHLTAGVALLMFFSSIAIGYLLNVMKVYQLMRHYKVNKALFFDTIAETLNVQRKEALYYFSKAADLERKLGGGDVNMAHVRWVMSFHSAFLFFLAAVIWLSCGIYYLFISNYHLAVILIPSSCIFFLIALRLNYSSVLEKERSTIAYHAFCRDNKSLILASVKREPLSPDTAG